MSVDQIFHFIFFFPSATGQDTERQGKMMTRYNKIQCEYYDPAQSIFQFKPYYYIPEIELLNGDAQCELPI